MFHLPLSPRATLSRCFSRVRLQALVAAQMKMEVDRENRRRPWQENELSSLAKAISKFPAGSQNREYFLRLTDEELASLSFVHFKGVRANSSVSLFFHCRLPFALCRTLLACLRAFICCCFFCRRVSSLPLAPSTYTHRKRNERANTGTGSISNGIRCLPPPHLLFLHMHSSLTRWWQHILQENFVLDITLPCSTSFICRVFVLGTLNRPKYCWASNSIPTGWEHIANFISQATRAKDPFNKEECIAKYQQIHAAPAGPQKKGDVSPATANTGGAGATSSANSTTAPNSRPERRESRVSCI